MNKKGILIGLLFISGNLFGFRHSSSMMDPFSDNMRMGMRMQHMPMSNKLMLPAKDVYEKNGNLIVEIDVSGLKPENLDVSIEGRALKVIGKQEERKEEKDREYYLKEIRTGSFELFMTLPVEVVTSKVLAKVENGKLFISAPKKESDTKAIKVEVK